jgi:hypothetical protein
MVSQRVMTGLGCFDLVLTKKYFSIEYAARMNRKEEQ